MSRTPGVLTKKLIALWILTIACVGAVWVLGRLDEVVPDDLVLIWDLNPLATPRPEVFAAVLGVGLLGSVLILFNILLRLRDSDQTINLVNLLIGLGTAGTAGFFVFIVLSNDDETVPVIGQTAKPEAAPKLRLLSLNVLHGYPDFEEQEQRLKDTAKLLRHLNADVMVFQEVWNTNEHGNMVERLTKRGTPPDRLSNTIDFTYVFARANGSRSLIGFEEGAAMVSRYRMHSAKRFLLKPREPWWQNRIALLARLDIGGDETLTLVGVHLSNSSSADQQAEHLLEVMRDRSPDIIAGDFNVGPDSAAVAAVLKQGFVAAIPKRAMLGTKPVDLPVGPFIDHVFLSEAFLKRWTLEDAAWIVTSKPVTDDPIHTRMAVSDHDGLLIDLRRR